MVAWPASSFCLAGLKLLTEQSSLVTLNTLILSGIFKVRMCFIIYFQNKILPTLSSYPNFSGLSNVYLFVYCYYEI